MEGLWPVRRHQVKGAYRSQKPLDRFLLVVNRQAFLRYQLLCELLQCFCGSMPCLIWGAFFVGVLRIAWADCVVLLMLQLVNGSFGWHEDTKASAAISALKASLQPQALCRRNGSDNDIQARDLVPGDIVLLSAGSVVPADCELLTGPVT